MTPEIILITVVVAFLLISYLIVYPLFVGADVGRLMSNDIITSVLALAVAGRLYWGSGVEFSFLGISMNWFVFTLSSYMALEFPLFKIYCKRYSIDLNDYIRRKYDRDE